MATDITWTNTTVKLGDLQPWQRNPRKSSKKQAQKMLESWDKFGQVQTIAIGPGLEVYDGHQRLSALLTVHGKGYTVDARQASRELTEQEREQLVITLHVGATGSWDWDELVNWDANSLLAYGMDTDALKQLNTDAAALSLLLESEKPTPAEDPGAQVDRAEELREKWGVELGQMWQLGAHRLICGDCTDASVVARVMGGEKAEITFTSPPYNAALGSNLPNKDKYQTDNDAKTEDEYLQLLVKFTALSLEVSEFVFVNVQSIAGNKLALIDFLHDMKSKFSDVMVWDKMTAEPAMAKNVLNSRFEYVYIFSQNAKRSIGCREFRGTIENVIVLNSRQGKEFSGVHKATFPVDFPSFFVSQFSNDGAIVYEPFSGSGTTLIACEQLGRKCRAVEITPAYVAVALQRFADMTGATPTLVQP